MIERLPDFLANLDPNIYFSDDYLVLDFEIDTSHGDYGNPIHADNAMLLGVWKFRGNTRIVWGDEFAEGWEQLRADVKAARFLVAHNAKYELGWLRRLGVDLRTVFPFDTQIAEYVLLGNLAAGAKELGMAPMSTSLDMCCRRRGMPIKDQVVDTFISNGINPVRIPRPWLESRCKQDVETTEVVFLSQRDALKESNRLAVLYTRCLLTPVLADIETEGLAVDPDEVNKTYEDYRNKLAKLTAEWNEFSGGVNMNSPKQKATFIYDKLGFKELTDRRGNPKRGKSTNANPSGLRKTDDKTLQLLAARTADQKRFLTLRKELSKVASALSKNLEFFKGIVNEYGGIFHAQLHQTSTATNRLSSTGIPLWFKSLAGPDGKPVRRSVQFQNFPRGFKKLFRAKRVGWLMAEPDGSGLEFRTAVELGHDKQGLEDINLGKGFDPHKFTASKLHNATIEEVVANELLSSQQNVDSWRQLAKPDTFKPLYGGSRGTPDQERYYAAFRERYPGIAKAQETWVDSALLDKQLVTPWGLIFFFPTSKAGSNGYVNVTSTVYNYPIQALATAEIIPIALVYLWHRIRQRGLERTVYIVNTVHDSAPCEVHPSAVDAFVELCKVCFTSDVYHYIDRVYGMDFSVPLGVGIKIGDHWGTGKEQSFNIYPSGEEVRIK